MPTNLVSSHVTTSLCHLCYTSLLYINFLLKRHLSRGHKIFCPEDHLEWTGNKLFSGMIGPRHMTTIRELSIRTGWRDAPLAFCNLAKTFSNTKLYIWPSLSKDHQNSNNSDSLFLLFDGLGKWKPIILYRKINIASFIFPSKNV